MTKEIKSRIEQIKSRKVPQGYKQSHAGIIPTDWDEAKISDVATELTETAGDRKYETLSISAGSGFVNQAQKFGKELSGKQYEKYIVLHKGDFSYNKGNSNAYPQGCIYCLNDREKAAVPNVFESFRIKKGNPDYYEQLFISGYLNKQLYSKINHGVRDDGLLNLTGKDFYSCFLPIFSLLEQQKIADILAQCDKVIALKKARIEEEKKQKKWLMQNLLDPNSGVRLPGFENSKWEKTNIGCVTISFSGGTPESSKKEYYCENGIPFIRSGEISSTKTELFLTQKGYQNSSAKMVNKGDLLYALYGANSGDCFISQIHGAINQAILCIRSTKVNIVFLYYVLKNAQNHIVSTYLQGGQGNLSAAIIKKISAFIPIQNEQIAICKVLSTQDEKIHRLEQELAQWQQKKKALMQLLLTGIARVPI